MATVTSTFTADGVSAALTGVVGAVTVSAKHQGVADTTGNLYIEVSYDAGTTWDKMEGGNLGNGSVDRTVIVGEASVQIRLKATGVNGTIRYWLGGSA